MASNFVALPVNQGDAFLYSRDDRRALIDGGKSARSIIGLVAAERVEHLDVLVCTHNDKDHAGGVAGLLDADAVGVGEVWLPGRWSQRIVDLCRSSDDFLDELAENVAASSSADLETAAAEPPPKSSSQGTGREEAQRESAEAAEAAVRDAIEAIDEPEATRWHWPWFPRRFRAGHWELWVACLTAADRIRRIAKSARDAGAKIRWFDFEEFSNGARPSGGIADFLVPVNAVEITPRLVKARISAFDYLRLSVANRESLVFYAPTTQQDADILFTADSDLGFALPTLRTALVTAPHHGSDANSSAYSAVQQVAGAVTWVRSDGRFHSRPGQTYLALQGSAYCTRCRGGTGPGQSVRAEDGSGIPGASWKMAPSVRPCHCK